MSNLIDRAAKSVGREVGAEVSNFAWNADGFSFTVATELEAYKAAYKYRYAKEVLVKHAPHIGAWFVRVTKDDKAAQIQRVAISNDEASN